jgi:hypothetical protein
VNGGHALVAGVSFGSDMYNPLSGELAIASCGGLMTGGTEIGVVGR